MRSLRNLSIHGKIISIVLVIVCLMAVMLGSGIYYLTAINGKLSRVVEVDVEKMRLAAQVKSELLEVHRAQKNLILSTSEEMAGEMVDRKRVESARLMENLARLEALTDRNEQARIRRLQGYLEEFLGVDEAIEAMVISQYRSVGYSPVPADLLHADAALLSMGTGRYAYDRATGLMDDIVEQMEAAMKASRDESQAYFTTALAMMLGLGGVAVFGGLLGGLASARAIVSNLGAVVRATDAIADGKLYTRIDVDTGDETGRLARSVEKMQSALLAAATASENRDWLKTGIARLNTAMQGRRDLPDLCTHVIGEVAGYMDAQVGAVFVVDESGDEPALVFAGGYACSDADFPARLRVDEGLPGQAMVSGKPITLKRIPDDYLKIRSGLGESDPETIVIAPPGL